MYITPFRFNHVENFCAIREFSGLVDLILAEDNEALGDSWMFHPFKDLASKQNASTLAQVASCVSSAVRFDPEVDVLEETVDVIPDPIDKSVVKVLSKHYDSIVQYHCRRMPSRSRMH